MRPEVLPLPTNREQLHELLRSTSVSELRQRLAIATLDAEQHEPLDATLAAWEWRALGLLPLRDALLADPGRGQPFYRQLCATLLGEEAEHLPDELLTLLPPAPRALAEPPFEAPSGLRWAVATGLVAIGAAWLAGQLLLLGSMPVRTAGVPLALFTLALLVGVRARLPGLLGAACIWLVANLPGFHYRTMVEWPALLLLPAGLFLLACDRRIRAMWAWTMGRYQKRAAIPPK